MSTKQELLRARTKRFALGIIRLVGTLPPTTAGRVIGRQILESGTSVGANYRAVCRARSEAEFIAKLGLVLEETDESVYWLELLAESGICNGDTSRALTLEAEQLVRIFSAGVRTARMNRANRSSGDAPARR